MIEIYTIFQFPIKRAISYQNMNLKCWARLQWFLFFYFPLITLTIISLSSTMLVLYCKIQIITEKVFKITIHLDDNVFFSEVPSHTFSTFVTLFDFPFSVLASLRLKLGRGPRTQAIVPLLFSSPSPSIVVFSEFSASWTILPFTSHLFGSYHLLMCMLISVLCIHMPSQKE